MKDDKIENVPSKIKRNPVWLISTVNYFAVFKINKQDLICQNFQSMAFWQEIFQNKYEWLCRPPAIEQFSLSENLAVILGLTHKHCLLTPIATITYFKGIEL